MILFGASGHAKVIIDILEKQGVEINYLVDANSGILELQSYQVIHENAFEKQAGEQLIISIGSNAIRKKVAEKLQAEYGWAIHPSATLGDDVTLGNGSVIMAGAIINSSSSIGNHVIVNTGSSIDHDCNIGDYAHISPKATLCGTVSIGEGAHIGAGATIIPNLTVGKWVTVGAGTVIIDNVPDYAVVVGNPGRIIKYNDSET